MATISIRVSDDIKKSMDTYAQINWSAVLRNAVKLKLQEEKIKQALYEASLDEKQGRLIPHEEIMKEYGRK